MARPGCRPGCRTPPPRLEPGVAADMQDARTHAKHEATISATAPCSITGADAMHSTALLVGSGFSKLWQMTVVFGGIELVLSQVGHRLGWLSRIELRNKCMCAPAPLCSVLSRAGAAWL